MFKLRDYQEAPVEEGFKQCLSRGWCYLSMEMRTGKTLTALSIAARLGGFPKRVVFITTARNIRSKAIQKDIDLLNDPSINVEVINYESIHKIDMKIHVDIWIIDEAHKIGAFPKPSVRAKWLKQNIHKHSSVIYLSGSPTPESYSQVFHQLWILGEKSPFLEVNFYKWAAVHCNITLKYTGHGYPVKDYKDCKYPMDSLMFIPMTQEQAGFKNKLQEHFVDVKMSETTRHIIKTLKKDKIFQGANDVILADTGAKEMQKIHQLGSGTCILDESHKAKIIDPSKAVFLKENFKDEKLAIFYKFKEELEMLKEYFDITQDQDEFNNTDKHIALQFVSGREGAKLDQADCIIAFNIDFSATTYFQFRQRMVTIEREVSDIYYLMSDCGIEKDIYDAVKKKKNYTLSHYKKTNKEVETKNTQNELF
jgi:hypothetical protein